ncbi:VWA domain-containing protein [Agarivorans sp.]|uniref:vWA domain-containing protein n=1 Tax=Agarivorans sp. TaxID=1872412 RepID=UPI003CFD2F21
MLGLSLLRPEWLLLSPLLLLLLIKKQQHEKSAWSQLLKPAIAKYLVNSESTRSSSQWPLAALFSLIIIALSGPSIMSDNVPVFREGSARVLIMDMSYSMRAQDLKPDRVELAKYKALDLLAQWKDGETALIAYAGDAFVLSPLSSDSNTLANLVPHLKPELMPVHGSALNLAIDKAAELIKQAGYAEGDIVLIGDGISAEQLPLSLASLQQHKLRFSMLAIGTEEGAPIPLEDGSMLKDQTGSIVMAKLDVANILPLCQQTGGICQRLSADNSDIEKLASLRNRSADEASAESQQAAARKDIGYLLLPLIILLMLIQLRRGDLVMLLCSLPLLGLSQPASANLWQNQAQQAEQAWQQQDYQRAAELFKDPNWQAAAYYKAGDYKKAQQLYAQDNSATAWYNQANALTQQGEYQQAIDAYQQALNQQPDFAEAKHNKQLVEKLLEQQQQHQQQQNNDQSSQSGEQSEQPEQSEKSDQSEQSEQNAQQDASSQDAQQEQQNGDQQQAEQQQAEQQAQQQAQAEQAQDEQQDNQQNTAVSHSPSDPEQQQELQKWLEELPNDPSLLLRNKMYLEYQKRRRQPSNQENW